MAITVKINGVNREASIEQPSMRVAWLANMRSEASFTMVDTAPGSIRPLVGHSVEIFDSAVRIFYGLISEFSEFKIQANTRLYYEISALDYAHALDHHLVAKTYANATLKAIVENIVSDELAGHGFTTTGVQTGPTISKAIFNYTTAGQAFAELSELTGYAWWVDENKDLKFVARDTVLAPFSVTQSNITPNFNVRRTIDNYRNVQYVRAGNEVTATQTEGFKGDSSRRVFNVAYPVAQVPTITVAAVSKTVGIRGLETGFDWYWNKGATEISQDVGASPINSTTTLQVVYKGLYPIIVRSDDNTAIADRAGVESTTGFYESIESDASIESSQLALDKADGLLRRYASIPVRVSFSTRTAGLRAGQVVAINISEHVINGNYLLDSVSAVYENGLGFLYSCTALSGETVGGWVEFFRKLYGGNNRYVIRENEVLIRVARFSDQVNFTDPLTASSSTSSCGIVDVSLVGMAQAC